MLLTKMRRIVSALVLTSSPTSVAVFTLSYLVISYLLLFIANEPVLTNLDTFFYWIMVTASTVGYGDFSPSTQLGKIASIFWIIPMGLTIFALVLTKIGIIISDIFLQHKRGLDMIENSKHTVIIGYIPERTARLVELLQPDTSKHSIVLCVDAAMENPFPNQVAFVSVESYSHPESMARVNLKQASNIIIDTASDDVTLKTALYCDTINEHCHKTAYFQDDSVAKLLQQHCPNIEIVPSVSIEMLAKSAIDPGSSLLHKQLLDATEGMTQYSMQYSQQDRIEFSQLFNVFKQQYNATLIGIKETDKTKINLNPHLDTEVNAGDILYYICQQRINDL